jgi:alkanesulfonate monooxygenase SsuD/methylene tetrahydromethanopterin reductase-like flavin-dependent oxidoreductase (luciferase family)/hemerythrin-like domain-containing protein
MADDARTYGHDLLFGSFLSPTADAPQQSVDLAVHCEAAGLDLVTFQDHPYQPRFLDTWTLLSYVAARTERIHLAPNVANVPLRTPAVLARSAASLDLLSGGRFELAVGAGAFWDAIEAMGVRRLTAGQSVDALAEAIEVIRQVWDAEARGGVRVDGEHHRVVGAKRGPAPAHPVPIWVGALKPRMLRLVGRLADGWLPSLFYLDSPNALREMNAVIDEAATETGRDPRSVRRMLNVGAEHADADFLTELALLHGISTFILASDDPRALAAFGEQVAPEVRRQVEAERALKEPEVQVQALTNPAVEVEGALSTLAGARAPVGGPPPSLGVAATSHQPSGRPLPWDESARPSATPPADHPYTARGRQVSKHLVDVHDALRGELQQVRDLLDQVRQGALEVGAARSLINTMALRQNNWTLGAYCESYCRIVTQHHTLEDEGIFTHLRRVDGSLVPVIDRLEAEHHVIADVLEQVDRALVALVGDPASLDRVAEAVDLLTDTLLSHLAYEERELLEPLARHGMYAGQL